MAGLEALAMGVPVIASDNRGTREYMEHRKNGFVCQFDDTDGFIRGMEAIRHQSGERKRRMQARCIESVKPFGLVYASAVMRRVYADVSRRIERREYEN